MENLIEGIFDFAQESDEYMEIPEMAEAYGLVYGVDEELRELLGDSFTEVDRLATEQLTAIEKGAFIAGFKIAMNLIMQSKLPKAVSK